MKIHEPGNFRKACLYCKKNLASVKYISKPVEDEDGLEEVIFFDSHRICSKQALEIAFLKNEIKEREKELNKFRKRLNLLVTKQIDKFCEIGATLN